MYDAFFAGGAPASVGGDVLSNMVNVPLGQRIVNTPAQTGRGDMSAQVKTRARACQRMSHVLQVRHLNVDMSGLNIQKFSPDRGRPAAGVHRSHRYSMLYPLG